MDMRPGMSRMSLSLALVAATAWYVVGESCAAQHQHPVPRRLPPRVAQPTPQPPTQPTPQPSTPPQPVKQSSPMTEVEQLSAFQEAIARAIGRLEAGHQQEALEELKQLRTSLGSPRQATDKNATPSFVNDRCPITGTPIDPAKVLVEMTRMHEGCKVAFCCTGCPQTWDRLGSPWRDAKLARVVVWSW